jgi:glucokinase
MDKVVIGVDLGGTIVRAGAFDKQGTLLAVRETPIEAARGPESGLRKMQGLIEQVWAESGAETLVGIGIGSTGPIDPIHGIINNPFTLPTWENVQVFEWMKKAFSVPITLENDADVAALGEYWKGAGKAAQRLYAVTLGTGIGAALIVDGNIYRGLDGVHPEGGHMVLDPNGPLCYCKMRGCWESLCAGPAIEQQARESNLSGSSLLEMASGEPDKIEARMVFDAARAGDATAKAIVDRFTQYLIQGILNVCILFVPDMIVLSGGIMRSADLFMPRLEAALQAYTEMVPAYRVHITPAKLGYYAGLYGAAYTIWSKVL